jgi:hypothetical protein
VRGLVHDSERFQEIYPPTKQVTNQSINHNMKDKVSAATSGLAVMVEMVLFVVVCLPLPISISTGGGGG